MSESNQPEYEAPTVTLIGHLRDLTLGDKNAPQTDQFAGIGPDFFSDPI